MGGLKNVYVHGIFTKKLVKQRGVLSILGHGRVKGMIKQNEIGRTKKERYDKLMAEPHLTPCPI